MAQSGIRTTRRVLDLDTVAIVHEVSYPYSTAPSGVSVKNSQYWFDEIAKVNSKFDLGA